MNRLTAQLRGKWVVQKYGNDDRWHGILVHPTIPADPFTEAWPFTGKPVYDTEADATAAMQQLRAKHPDIPMRVAPVEKDLNAAQLRPLRHHEQQRYGEYPSWGELIRRFPQASAFR